MITRVSGRSLTTFGRCLAIHYRLGTAARQARERREGEEARGIEEAGRREEAPDEVRSRGAPSRPYEEGDQGGGGGGRDGTAALIAAQRTHRFQIPKHSREGSTSPANENAALHRPLAASSATLRGRRR